MPTYDYECQACGNRLEVTQRITEAALVDCPACHAPKLQRIISATAFMLKGGGWYKDGYSSGSGKPRTENDRIDRLSKALDDDKKKTAAEGASASDTASPSSPTGGSSDSSASTSTASSGSSSSGSSSA